MSIQEMIVPTASSSPTKAMNARKARRDHLKAVHRRDSRSSRNFSISEIISSSVTAVKSARSVRHA